MPCWLAFWNTGGSRAAVAAEQQWLWQQRWQKKQRMQQAPSKQFWLNHGDPQNRLHGLCWPSGFIPAPTNNFKSGCKTMHVHACGMVFRSCVLMSHEDGVLVCGPFWRNQTSNTEQKYGYISHAHSCDKLGHGPKMLIMWVFLINCKTYWHHWLERSW